MPTTKGGNRWKGKYDFGCSVVSPLTFLLN